MHAEITGDAGAPSTAAVGLQGSGERAYFASQFRRFGLIGFWIQIVLGTVPVISAGLMLLFTPGSLFLSARTQLLGVLSLASLSLLAFTTIWFLLYARLGRRLAEGGAIDRSALRRRVKFGIIVSLSAILLSTIVTLLEVAYLLFILLDAPQGGIPVIATDPGVTSGISAVDMLSLLALNFTITAEIVALGLGLMLLWRVVTGGASPDDLD
jgi:hypothetical protein